LQDPPKFTQTGIFGLKKNILQPCSNTQTNALQHKVGRIFAQRVNAYIGQLLENYTSKEVHVTGLLFFHGRAYALIVPKMVWVT
jgi:hypothetical protein